MAIFQHRHQFGRHMHRDRRSNIRGTVLLCPVADNVRKERAYLARDATCSLVVAACLGVLYLCAEFEVAVQKTSWVPPAPVRSVSLCTSRVERALEAAAGETE
jgi:hypothetical protein